MKVLTPELEATVISIEEVLAQTELGVAASAGATTIEVVDVDELDFDGGTLTIGAEVIAYEIDEDSEEITLAAPLGSAYPIEEVVSVYPPSVERLAYVRAGEDDEELEARVPHALFDKLDLGTRDESDESAELVLLALEDEEWVITDLLYQEPVIDGTYIDPETLPEPPPAVITDGLPPASSPTPAITAGPGYLYAEWAAITNADAVTYEIHVSATTGFTPSAATAVAATPGLASVVVALGDGTPLAPGTTYYVKTIAKDADGAAAASAQGSGSPIKIAIAHIDPIDFSVITGQATNAQIVGLAASKVTGQMTNAQIAALDAAKLTGQVVEAQIADLAISAAKVAANAITTTKLANDAVDAAKIAAGAVSSSELATGAVIAGKIAADAVGPTELAALAVTSAKIAANAVTVGKIGADAVTAAEIAADAVGSTEIAALAVTSAEVAANAITVGKIAADAVDAGAIAAGAVGSSEIATGAVGMTAFASGIRPPRVVAALPTTPFTGWAEGDTAYLTTDDKLYRFTGTGFTAAVPTTDLSGTINNAQIADDAINAAKIAADAVTASEIATGAVGSGEIAAGAVIAGKITAGTIVTGDIASGTITGGNIAADTLTAGNIAASAITASELAANSVIAGKILAGTIVAADIAANTITAGQIATGAIAADEVAAGAITAGKIGADAVTATEIAANAITASELAANSITAADMLANTITAGQIATGTITAATIAAGTITTTEIAANTITAADILAGTITTTEIAATTITAADIAATTITAGQIAADTLTAAQINAGAITSSELATGAVIAGKITAGAIVAADIAADTITASQIAANAITSAELNAGAVIAGKIAAGSIVAADIAANIITAGQIATGAIASDEIAANTIVAGDIAAGTITTTEILANTILAADIAAGTVTTTEIAATTIVAGDIAANTLTAQEINAGAITSSELAAGAVIAGKITAGSIVAGDLAVGTLTANEIAANAITASELAANSVTAADILAGTITTAEIAAGTIVAGNIAAGAIDTTKLTATAIDGMTITGALIRTAATGSRVELDSSGIRAYDALANETFTVDSASGQAHLTGTVDFGTGSALGVDDSLALIEQQTAGYQTPKLVQSASDSGSSGAIEVSLPSFTSPYSVVIGTLYTNHLSATHTAPAGWAKLTEVINGSLRLSMYYRNGASTLKKFNPTVSTGCPFIIQVFEYSGLTQSIAPDVFKTNSGTGVTGAVSTTATATTTQTHGLSFASLACSSSILIADAPIEQPRGYGDYQGTASLTAWARNETALGAKTMTGTAFASGIAFNSILAVFKAKIAFDPDPPAADHLKLYAKDLAATSREYTQDSGGGIWLVPQTVPVPGVQSGRISRGTTVIVSGAGNPQANSAGIPHGLGVTPAAVVATADRSLGIGTAKLTATATALTATDFNLMVRTGDNTNIGAGNVTVYWIAMS